VNTAQCSEDTGGPAENVPTEPIAECENSTNEPNWSSSQIDVSPFPEDGFAGRSVGATETNEPNFGRSSVVSGPLSGEVSSHEEVTPEPSAVRDNDATNEVPGAAEVTSRDGAGSVQGARPSGQVSYTLSDGTEMTFDKVAEFMVAQIADLQRQRAERHRKRKEERRQLNESARARRPAGRRLDSTPAASAKTPTARRNAREPSSVNG
jgi:hypothetical protein